MIARGRFIALEGGEGSGKSTQAVLLAGQLGAELTREPGGTRLGEAVRAVFLDPKLGSVDARAEVLLMAAQRAQHVAEVITPALQSGRWVVTDRFAGSTLAYQGYGRGVDPVAIRGILAWAAADLWPDLNVLLEVDVATMEGRRRLRGEGLARSADPEDRMEAEDAAFHRRFGEGYRSMAASDPAHWVVVDGAGAAEEVARRIADAVAGHFDGVRQT